MLGIIKRDISLMFSSRQMILFMVLYVPFLLLMFGSSASEQLYLMIIVLYTYMMSLMSFSFDIAGKSRYIINSLPIRRNNIVIYKYLSVFVYFAITVAFAGVYLWIINILNLANVDYFNLNDIIIGIPTVMISTSIVFPAYFRFEARIAQIIHFIVFLTSFTIFGNVAFVGDKGILKYLSYIKLEHVIVVALVLYILSLVLSVVLYKNRDL